VHAEVADAADIFVVDGLGRSFAWLAAVVSAMLLNVEEKTYIQVLKVKRARKYLYDYVFVH
jgi:hypothetical protein